MSHGKQSSNGGVGKKRISSSIFLALKTSDNEEENASMEHNLEQMNSTRNQVQVNYQEKIMLAKYNGPY